MPARQEHVPGRPAVDAARGPEVQAAARTLRPRPAMAAALTSDERRLVTMHRAVSFITEQTFGLNSACTRRRRPALAVTRTPPSL